MKFWDTSAIVPLLVEEPESQLVESIFREDSEQIVWWGTSIECVSAVSRLEREGALAAIQAERIIDKLRLVRSAWREVLAGAQLKQTAERILRVHPLRAQDAQQLAACLIVNSSGKVPFVSLDSRLNTAARKEGLDTEGR
jgi:predicted nucleic acid-binding protein